MNQINTNVFYILSTISASLGLVTISVFIMYLRLVKKYLVLKDETDKTRVETNQKYESELAKAAEEIKAVIGEANSKVVELQNASQVFSEGQRRSIESLLKKAAEEEIKLYQKTLSDVGNASINVIQRLSQDLGGQITPELDKIRKTIETEVAAASEETKKSISSAYSIVEKQVEEYEREMLGEVDKMVVSVVKDLSKKVLGKTISERAQEELILSSLEQAKKQGVI